MHSLGGGRLLVLGGLVGSCVRGAAVPAPAITPAPSPSEIEARMLMERQDPDAISLARVLLSVLPLSLRVIAATNLQAVSSILWEEFLDDNRPDWFRELPYDIQSYLIREFGPKTAAPPDSPGWDGEATTTAEGPSETGGWQPSQTEPLGSETGTGLFPSETAPSETDPTASSALPSNSAESSFASTPTTLVTTRSGSNTFSHSQTATDSTPNPSSSSSSEPAAPAEDSEGGLTQKQKVGLGVGIPFGILGAAALFFGCCFLLRRRRKRDVDGSIPPSSPGFIPRFSFQDRGYSYEHHEHRAPLNPGNQQNTAYMGPGTTNWEDDGYDPADFDPPQRAGAFPPTHAMHDSTPIMAPVLFHTHSSNRARGKRTSYTSLRSVAELTEPDEESAAQSVAESPVLGHYGGMLPGKQSSTRRSSLPSVSENPPMASTDAAGAGIAAAIIGGSQIKRKPVPTSPTGMTPTRETSRSRSLLRPPLLIPGNSGSGSSSSGRAIGGISNESSTSKLSQHTDATSPVSPISPSGALIGMNPFAAPSSTNQDVPSNSSHHNYNTLNNSSPSTSRPPYTQPKTNPFAGGYDYIEDYGPEFSHNGYTDLYADDGLYGGNRSLDRYPEPTRPMAGRRGSKGEWPLRNVMGSGHRRNKSPLWDRVYDGPR